VLGLAFCASQAGAFPTIDGTAVVGEWDAATTQTDPVDVLPTYMVPGNKSGFDIVEMRVIVDPATNDMYFLIKTDGVPGDADGDGNPNGTSNSQINDLPGVGGPETYKIYLDCNIADGAGIVDHEIWIINNSAVIMDVQSGAPVPVSTNVTWSMGGVVEIKVSAYDICPIFIAANGFSFQMQGYTNTPYDGPVSDMIPDTGFLLVDATVPPADETGPGNGVASQGYWKNHLDDWFVRSVVLGGVTYTQADAIENILKKPVKGDKTVAMAKQLLAAKLNYWDGNDTSCIDDAIAQADAWLISVGGIGVGIRTWDGLDLVHDELDAYNNGLLCAPHRDRD